ncbi:MAG: hypothetical protein PHE55_00250 [Methylococcaceae bacterium]|nr:hypothetical protein [Methylococcaceae bacterium]
MRLYGISLIDDDGSRITRLMFVVDGKVLKIPLADVRASGMLGTLPADDLALAYVWLARMDV